MAAEGAFDGPVALRLELVVELLRDALADLSSDRLRVQPRRHPLDQPQDQVEVAEVDLDRLGHARVLDLDRDPIPVVGDGAVDLADRGGGERLRLELGEVVADPAPEVALDDLADVVVPELRRVVAELGERGAELLLALLGEAGELDRREDLADLHRRPLHLAELAGDLDGDAADALVGRLLGALLVAGQVRDPGPGPAEPLTGDHPAHAGGPPDATRADPRRIPLVAVAGRFLLVRHRRKARRPGRRGCGAGGSRGRGPRLPKLVRVP